MKKNAVPPNLRSTENQEATIFYREKKNPEDYIYYLKKGRYRIANLRYPADQVLKAAKNNYDKRDKTVVMHCLAFCFNFEVPIPTWLKLAFLKADNAAMTYKIKSWDEAFGPPLKKGKWLASEHRKHMISGEIFNRLTDQSYEAGKPIDKKLFEAVGKEFGVSGTIASEIYYEGCGDIDRLLAIELPRKLKKIRDY
jgi:hypothetical protein